MQTGIGGNRRGTASKETVTGELERDRKQENNVRRQEIRDRRQETGTGCKETGKGCMKTESGPLSIFVYFHLRSVHRRERVLLKQK
jgi:hypothetical protein